MNYEEGLQHALTVRWEARECDQGSECWCRAIAPEVDFDDDDGNQIFIAAAGTVHREFAEHIVKLHNDSLEAMETTDEKNYEFAKLIFETEEGRPPDMNAASDMNIVAILEAGIRYARLYKNNP